MFGSLQLFWPPWISILFVKNKPLCTLLLVTHFSRNENNFNTGRQWCKHRYNTYWSVVALKSANIVIKKLLVKQKFFFSGKTIKIYSSFNFTKSRSLKYYSCIPAKGIEQQQLFLSETQETFRIVHQSSTANPRLLWRCLDSVTVIINAHIATDQTLHWKFYRMSVKSVVNRISHIHMWLAFNFTWLRLLCERCNPLHINPVSHTVCITIETDSPPYYTGRKRANSFSRKPFDSMF